MAYQNPLLDIFNNFNYNTANSTPAMLLPKTQTLPNPLLDIFNNYNYNTANSTPAMLLPKTQTLPNGGGTYNPAGKSTIVPERDVQIVEPPPSGNVSVVGWMDPKTGKITKGPLPKTLAGGSIYSGAKAPVSTAPVPAAETPKNNFYEKYRDPKTGKLMTPEEYAVHLRNKVPKGTGDITNYAGDAMANPNQSAEALASRARTMNNARNDIATGTTDPYKIGASSGIAYSPQELRAIEKAYSGIYDPALNDVFSRMSEAQKAEAKRVDREDRIFATNESIRQWRATTGSKAASGGSGGSATPKGKFTQSQLNDGASNAGIGMESFASLDDDIKNFYVNPPMGLNDEEKKVPMYQNFEAYFDKVLAGEVTADEVNGYITESNLPPSVKHYFINQIPADPEKKEGLFDKIWNKVKEIF